jgi:LCP family protein required for cell wall assembly
VTDATDVAPPPQPELPAPGGGGLRGGGPEPPAHDPSRIRYYAVPPRGRRWTWILGAIGWALLAAVVAIAFGIWVDAEGLLRDISPNTKAVQEARAVLDKQTGKATTFLILGSDRRADDPAQGARSDTMILMRIDPQREAISLLSIPRDLKVTIPGASGFHKINEAYSIGGPKLAISTVKQTLGVEINHWADLNFQGFFELVQHLGGVYVQVDHRYYSSGSSFAPIDLHPGYQLLNGNAALSYVRFRHTDTDFFRADRQQLVMLALKRRAAGQLGIGDVPGVMGILKKNLVTDVNDLGTVIDLVRVLLGLPKDRVFRTTLEATAGPSYVIADPTQIANSVAAYETPPLPGSGSTVLGGGRRIPPGRIRLVVRNVGAGLLGAEQTAEALRRKGYPAVAEGDAPLTVPRTTALYFSSDQQRAARQLSVALGVPAQLAPAGQAWPIELDVGQGFPVTDPIKPPVRANRPAPPAMVSDSAPGQAAASLGRIGLRVMVPTVRPQYSRLSTQEGVRAYRLSAGRNKGTWPALTFTFQDGSRAGRYWQLQETTMPAPPILEGANTTVQRPRLGRRYQIVFDGKNPRTLAFRLRGTWYWISNTLDTHLTTAEMIAIADGLRPLAGSGRGSP